MSEIEFIVKRDGFHKRIITEVFLGSQPDTLQQTLNEFTEFKYKGLFKNPFNNPSYPVANDSFFTKEKKQLFIFFKTTLVPFKCYYNKTTLPSNISGHKLENLLSGLYPKTNVNDGDTIWEDLNKILNIDFIENNVSAIFTPILDKNETVTERFRFSKGFKYPNSWICISLFETPSEDFLTYQFDNAYHFTCSTLNNGIHGRSEVQKITNFCPIVYTNLYEDSRYCLGYGATTAARETKCYHIQEIIDIITDIIINKTRSNGDLNHPLAKTLYSYYTKKDNDRKIQCDYRFSPIIQALFCTSVDEHFQYYDEIVELVTQNHSDTIYRIPDIIKSNFLKSIHTT